VSRIDPLRDHSSQTRPPIGLALIITNKQWGLARGSEIASDTVKARKAFRDFLTLWKDADSDIPILKEAKAEYAKLN
jgi:hypothetical protein